MKFTAQLPSGISSVAAVKQVREVNPLACFYRFPVRLRPASVASMLWSVSWSSVKNQRSVKEIPDMFISIFFFYWCPQNLWKRKRKEIICEFCKWILKNVILKSLTAAAFIHSGKQYHNSTTSHIGNLYISLL